MGRIPGLKAKKLPGLKAKKLFPLVPVGTEWKHSSGPARQLLGLGQGVKVLAQGVDPAWWDTVCAGTELSCSHNPRWDWHPGQQDQPHFARPPTSRSSQRGQGQGGQLVTGPASDAVDNPQPSRSSPNLGFNYNWAGTCGNSGEGSVQASSFPLTFT